MCKNKKLKEALQSLTQSVYYSPSGKFLWQIGFVTAISGFDNCIKLMEQDEKIKGHQGKLVGTYSGASTVRDEKTCILNFLKQIYFESEKYDQVIFDQKYLSFEEFFYSDNLAFKDTANLFNFSFDNNEELALGHGVVIKKAVEYCQEEDCFRRISKSPYVIERNYERKKIIFENTDKNSTKITSELPTKDLFDLVINSLRVLKVSAVYRDHRIKTESVGFHPNGGRTIIMAPVFENTVLGEKCNIEASDAIKLCKIFDFLFNEDDKRFKVVLRRLSLGIERKDLEDKLLDYMIGLETLYMPDGNTELSFRLSIRVAFLISIPKERKITFDFLRKMYSVRSNIVHGSKYDLKTDDVSKLEELLRKSVSLWIENKNKFSEDELNKVLFQAV